MPRFKEDIISDLNKLLNDTEKYQDQLVRDAGAEKVLNLRGLIENTLTSLGSFVHLKTPDAKARFARDGTPAAYRKKAREHLQKILTVTGSSGSLGCCCLSRFDRLFYAAQTLLQEADRLVDNPAHKAMAFGSDASGRAVSTISQLGYQAGAAP